MNTPAHVMINLLCLGRQDEARVLTPVILGALLPDVPMFIFYFVEKVIRSTSERVIWSQAYHQSGWQNFIDLFHSLPLMGLGISLSYWGSSKIGVLFFASMVLHVAGDLPLHHDDGHRHFFPLSNWRFSSPLSYWDPRHYGHIVGVLEILAVIVSCIVLLRLYESWLGKITIAVIGFVYVAYFVYVFTVWA